VKGYEYEIEKIADRERCRADRTLSQLQLIRTFNIKSREVNEHFLWLFSRGGDPERLARMGEIIAKSDNGLEQSLKEKIKNNFAQIPDVHSLEKEITRYYFLQSGVVHPSFGLDDIALLINPPGLSATVKDLLRKASLNMEEYQLLRQFTKSELSRETILWGEELATRMAGLGVEDEAFYILKRMHLYQKYAAKMNSLKNAGVKGKGTFFRAVRRDTEFPFYDAHPKSLLITKYRWHLPGEPAVYFGKSPKGVEQEIVKHFGSKWETNSVVHQLRVKYRNALDLTDHAILNRIGITEDVLLGSDPAHGQVISALARSMGFNAILSKSAAASADSCINLTLLRNTVVATKELQRLLK
jgi:hypothetical protein